MVQEATECGLHGEHAAAHAKENRQDTKFMHVVLPPIWKRKLAAVVDHGENTRAGLNVQQAVTEVCNIDRDITAAALKRKGVSIVMNVFVAIHQATGHGATGDLALSLAAKVYRREQQSEFVETSTNTRNEHAEPNNAANFCHGVNGEHVVPPASLVFKKEPELQPALTDLPSALNTETVVLETVYTICGRHGQHARSFAEFKPSRLVDGHTHA